MSRRRLPALLAPALAAALTLTACGGGGEEEPSSGSSHNAADVAFATDMIQHHAQALSMVDLTRDRPLDPEVQLLAEDIRAAQGPEIETMTDWLQEWDEEIPETMRDHSHAGHGDGDMADAMEGMDTDMPGMMNADEMTALEEASDEEFQQMWLEMMVEHHEGAVEMARAQQEEGEFGPAVELAADIEAAQTAEIDTMTALLD